jgi:hypothetical protein
VTGLIAFLLLLVMLVIGARVRGARDSWWKPLAFITACVVVLALLLAILAKQAASDPLGVIRAGEC